MEGSLLSDPAALSSAEASSGDATAPRRGRWQVGIRTLVLLTAACAVWLTFFVNRRHNAMLESRIRAMTPLAHELSVEDEKKIAVVKLDELWMDDNQWDLHLPPRAYRVCVATREITGGTFPPAAKSAALRPGRHRLVLVQERKDAMYHISVVCDGTPLVTVDEPKEWNPGVGSAGGGEFSTNQQMAADKPLVLYRKRFMHPTTKRFSTVPVGPSEGLMVWIEPLPEAPAGP
jgi:hypothetical protein